MGWSYSYHQARDVKEQIEGLFTTGVPGHSYEIVDSAIVGNTYYAAVRRTMPDHPSYVFAAVILFRNPKSGFGYKDMDESMGPCEVACPLRILDKLSPFEDMPGGLESRGYAAEWRARVREYHRTRATQAKKAKAFKVGELVKLATPVKFRSGLEEDTFTVCSYLRRGKKRTVYQAASTGALCSIPQRLLTDAKAA